MEIVKAFFFGFSLAISIGPIAVLIINQSINCGLKNGLRCGLGAALADFFYAFIAFFSGHLLFNLLKEQEKIISTGSSLILVIFGIWMVYQALKKIKINLTVPGSNSSMVCSRPLFATFGLTIINPLTVIVFSGLSGQYLGIAGIHLMLMAMSVFMGSLMVQFLLAIFGNQLAMVMNNRLLLTYLNILSGVAIIGFGVIKYF